jgi:hypothetical protein
MRGPAPALALLVLLVAGQAAPAADAALPSAAAPRPALQRVPGAGGGALLLLRLRGGAAGKYYRALGGCRAACDAPRAGRCAQLRRPAAGGTALLDCG